MNTYLQRYSYPIQFIEIGPSPNLNIIVTIPCFNEPDLLLTLNSLRNCNSPESDVEIIVVINHGKEVPKEITQQNNSSYKQATDWAKEYNSFHFKIHIIYVNDLPNKHAGVGLARKIAMDEAVRRFDVIGNSEGIIACFDADSTCDKNYLIELENHFIDFPKSPGCSIYFEHPLDEENQKTIVQYELFLRYYVNALRYTGFPYAFQTVGSSMAVRSWAYQKQDGMNRRKDGEDFYFLHRIIPLGSFTELKTTRVIPSPRDSNRVPFGTGQAMIDAKSGKKPLDEVYSPRTFEDLRIFFGKVDSFFDKKKSELLPDSVEKFLTKVDFDKELKRLRKQSSTLKAFRKHFFQWFDGFKVLKFIHFARDNYFNQVKLPEATKWLMKKSPLIYSSQPKEILNSIRELDKSYLGNSSKRNDHV